MEAGAPGPQGRKAAEGSADLNFKGSRGPSASALCGCVCGAGVSAHARLRVWRVSGWTCFVTGSLRGRGEPGVGCEPVTGSTGVRVSITA